MSRKEDAKKLLEKVNDLTTLEQDPRIEKKERSSLDFISNANWDLLKAMRVGVHHKQEFDCLGVKIYLRLLSSHEEETILAELMMDGLIPNTNGLWEMKHIKLVLSKASTPHPHLQSDEIPMLSMDTLREMPMFLIEEIGKAYIDFVAACNVNLDKLSESELKEVIEMLEKKPTLSNDLPFRHLVQVTIYLTEQYRTLKQLVDNLTTQS